jgi:hypothetical protein
MAVALLAVLVCVLVASAATSGAAQGPVNNFAPEVVGNPAVNERLVCASGSWAGNVSYFSYRWLRDGTVVSSSKEYSPYTVAAEDRGHSLTCVVTAVAEGEGSGEAESSNSLAIPGERGTPPENVSPPEVFGTPAVGANLTCSLGTWHGSPPPTYTYAWVRDKGLPTEASIGAEGATYQVQTADEGHSVSCKVTAKNVEGAVSRASSNGLNIPGGSAPTNTSPPFVSGNVPEPEVGESLECSHGTWTGSPTPTFIYQWFRTWGATKEQIPAATGSSYIAEPVDELASLSCKVTAENSLGKVEALSSNSVKIRGSKPINGQAPLVSGTPAVGHTLSCSTGTWSGVPAPEYEYQWVRDRGQVNEVPFTKTKEGSHPVTEADRGQSLTCLVTATNSEGSASQASNTVLVAEGGGSGLPVNTEPPQVSGTPAVGQVLSCSQGHWSGSPLPTSFSYQWLRDTSTIEAATSANYSVEAADEGHALSCVVTAMGSEGSAQAVSNSLGVPGSPPVNTEPPGLAGGTGGVAPVGESLTCLHGKWRAQGTPTYAYQWLQDGVSIAGAGGYVYRVAVADRGHMLSCAVTASSAGGGSSTAESGDSRYVRGSSPENTEAPTISGAREVGETLTCSPGKWTGQPTPTFTYQWLLNGIAISSATTSTYNVATVDRGRDLVCKVTGSVPREGTASAFSKAFHIPGVKPKDIEAPQVSGTPLVGQPLTCLRGIWEGKPPPAFAYQWLRDGVSIAAATNSTYTVELADQGHLLSCYVIATNSEGSVQAESSNGLAVFRGTVGAATKTEMIFTPPPILRPSVTTAEILAVLRRQLARAQLGARIATLRKTGKFSFPFSAPTAGTLEVSWYPAPKNAHSASFGILAASTTSFPIAGTETVRMRLTSTGRRALARSQRIKLIVKGVFLRPEAPPVSLLQTVALNR